MAVDHLTENITVLNIEEPFNPRKYRIMFGSYSEESDGEQFLTDLHLPATMTRFVDDCVELIMSEHFFFGIVNFISETPEGPPSKDPRMMYGQMFLKVASPNRDDEKCSYEILQAGFISMTGCDSTEDDIQYISKRTGVTGIFRQREYFDQIFWDAQRAKYRPFYKS